MNETKKKRQKKKTRIQSSKNLSQAPYYQHGVRNPQRPRKREHGGFGEDNNGRDKKRKRNKGGWGVSISGFS